MKPDAGPRTLSEWVQGGIVTRQTLRSLKPDSLTWNDELATEMIEDAQYAPYLARQEGELRDLRASESLRLAASFPYRQVPGLSNEMVERLTSATPATLGAASRVPGITPAALAAVLVHARKLVGAEL